jgi:hypothetical protein
MDACSVEGKVMAAALPRGMALDCSILGDTVFVDDPAALSIFSSGSSYDVPPQGGGGGGGGEGGEGGEGGAKGNLEEARERNAVTSGDTLIRGGVEREARERNAVTSGDTLIRGGVEREARERNAVTSGDQRLREEGERGREREKEREKLWAQAFAVCKGGTEVYEYGGIY